MTNIEFRLFFESLADTNGLGKGNQPPSKTAFAKECEVPISNLKGIVTGKRALTDATAKKLLPVMRQYGFQGE